MKKYIIPFGSIIKLLISFIFLLLAIVDLLLWQTILICVISFILFILLFEYGLKLIQIDNDTILISPDILIGWYKVQYKENIVLRDVSFIEVKKRDYTYSSRGQEKTGRGFETIITGNTFIEFNYYDKTIKRIHCNDLSKKQVEFILEYCKKKNIKIIK